MVEEKKKGPVVIGNKITGNAEWKAFNACRQREPSGLEEVQEHVRDCTACQEFVQKFLKDWFS